MCHEYLNRITTQWTQMEGISNKEGPAALADFLVARYFSALALQFKIYCPGIDDVEAHDLASSVMYELLKNDYRGIERLDRNKGHLRGLLATIAKIQIAQRQRLQNKFRPLPEQHRQDGQWVDVYMDLRDAIDKMKEKRPLLYRPFIFYYIEGKKLAEISQILGLAPNAIKQRLYSARRWLASELKDYQP